MFEREIVLFNFVKSYFHKLVADISDESLAEQPMPGVNHPAWIMGHLCIANDYVSQILGNEGACSYTNGSPFSHLALKLLADRESYPSKQELIEEFDLSHARAIVSVKHSTPEQMATPQLSSFYKEELPLVGDLIAHLMTTHPTSHLGQLSTWRRVKELPSVLGI